LAVDADREPVTPVIIGKVQVERDTHLAVSDGSAKVFSTAPTSNGP
jgi:hypothetical protein